MSYGHGETSATIHTPHGPVTVAVRVAWVRCDEAAQARAAAACATSCAIVIREGDR